MKEKNTYLSYMPYIFLSLIALSLLFRCFYGFCWSDEPFYFATSYRFYQGDSLFVHDWFPTQLSSILLLPLFSLFIETTGSTDGILLFFRISYVIYSFCISIVLYRIFFKKHSAFPSLICAVSYLFYAHLNIATLSYYTMSVGFYLLSMALIYHFYNHQRKGARKYLLYSGFFFALCVLSLPTMAAAYFLVLLCIGLFLLAAKVFHQEEKLKSAQLITVCLYTFYGICIPFFLFLFYMFSKISLPQLLEAIPYVLSDEEHITSLSYPFKKFFIGINQAYTWGAYGGYILIGISFLLGQIWIKKRLPFISGSPFAQTKIAFFKLGIVSLTFLLFLCYFIFSLGHTGYLFTGITLFGIVLYFITEKRNTYLFFLFVVSGLILSMVYSYSSNGYLYILSIGHCISALGCIFLIWDFMKELKEGKEGQTVLYRLFSFGCLVSLLILCIQTGVLRFINVYRDAPLSQLTTKITAGPAKGLYTTAEHHKMYKTVYDDIQNYATTSSGYSNSHTVFFTKLLPWGYLATDLHCASPTTWRTKFNSERLKPYYERNPEKYPELIFVLKEEIGAYDSCGDVVGDPSPNENELGGYLMNYIKEKNYESLELDSGVLYRITQ